MVDISTDSRETEIYSIMDCDAPGEPWFTFIVKSNGLGKTSGFPLEKRLQLLINNTPKMMKKAHESALKDYEIQLARFLAWDPIAAEARYQEAVAYHMAELRAGICEQENRHTIPGVPRRPLAPAEPVKPLPAVVDFDDVSLNARIRWLQYGDFDDAGIEIIEIIAGPPSCTNGHALEVHSI